MIAGFVLLILEQAMRLLRSGIRESWKQITPPQPPTNRKAWRVRVAMERQKKERRRD